MKTPDSRFYCPLITVGTIILDENESSHAVRVCRAVNGEILQLCDGLGHYADATIIKADAKACEVRVETVEDAPSVAGVVHVYRRLLTVVLDGLHVGRARRSRIPCGTN